MIMNCHDANVRQIHEEAYKNDSFLYACPNIAEESVQNALPATGFAQKEGKGVVGEVSWPSSF